MSSTHNSIREGDIPPRYGGPIQDPHRNDVLSGRGGRINAHPGNVQFRELVKEYRPAYLSDETKKLDKVKIAARIVQMIRSMNPPGRFLKEENKAWVEIGDEKARKKAGQAMREKADDFRKEQQNNANVATSPQQVLPGYQSQHATSPSSPAFVPSSGDPFLQMNNSPYLQSPYPQAGMMNNNMPPLQQMHYAQFSSPPQLGNLDLHNRSPESQSKTPGLLSGNAVAFNREFNRMSSSDSGNKSSVVVSSMGSINTSMSSANRSSLSSREGGRSVKILEPINDVKEESNASGWDDSWDQDAFATAGDESVISDGSARRKNMFRSMKNESSCLPSAQLAVTDDITRLNENELMKESLVSMEMQSVELKKSVNLHDNKSIQMASIQMDSINELIVDTMQSDEDIKSGGSFSMNSTDKKNQMQGGVKQSGMMLEKPKVQTRGVSGISTVSGMSSTSETPSWAAIEQTHSTLPDLPVGLTGNSRLNNVSDVSGNTHAVSNDSISNRSRMFSDYSNKSTSMMSEISMSMGHLNIDLDDDDNDEY